MESLHERMVRPPTPCHALMALLPARQWPAVQCSPPSQTLWQPRPGRRLYAREQCRAPAECRQGRGGGGGAHSIFAAWSQGKLDEDLSSSRRTVDAELLRQLEREEGEEEIQYLHRIQELSKEQSHNLDILSRKLWLKNHTKKGAEGGDIDQEQRHVLASQQLRAQALASVPKVEQDIFKELGVLPIYESSNTIVSSRPRPPKAPLMLGTCQHYRSDCTQPARSQRRVVSQGWLEDMQQAAVKKRSHEPVKDVWAVVFSMPESFEEAWKQNDLLAAKNAEIDALMHIHTESGEDFEARTVHVDDIPADHIIMADDDAEPSLSLELMSRLTKFGDVDTVTVRVRTPVHVDGADIELSWAFVTYETALAAEAAVVAGVTVPVLDRTTTGHHVIPERPVRITQARLAAMEKTGTQAARQVYKHNSAAALYR